MEGTYAKIVPTLSINELRNFYYSSALPVIRAKPPSTNANEDVILNAHSCIAFQKSWRQVKCLWRS